MLASLECADVGAPIWHPQAEMGVLDSASVFVCVSQWRCLWKSALDCGRKRATACAIAGESTAVDVPGCLLPGEGMAMAVWLGASGEGEA